MAAGKPMVVTDMAEMRPFEGEHLAIGRTPEEFHAAVHQAIEHDSQERRAASMRAARHESWDARVEQLSDLLAPMLAGQSRIAPGGSSDRVEVESA
jgi:hypothetical protein